MKALASIFILALLMLATGCQYDPHAHLYTTEEPQKTNVVGRYVLVSQSLDRRGMAALAGKVCAVELMADGTFVASNVPPWQQDILPGTNFFQTLVSARGTWSLTTVGAVYNGRGKSKPCWGVHLDASGARLLSPGFMGTKPPYGLIYTLGDPDSGDALILERANEHASLVSFPFGFGRREAAELDRMACTPSNGVAPESSPRREPWVTRAERREPRSGDRTVVCPPGILPPLRDFTHLLTPPSPTAHAVGYYLSLLRSSPTPHAPFPFSTKPRSTTSNPPPLNTDC